MHVGAPFFAQHRLSPVQPLHYLIYLGMLGVIVALAWLFHVPFEANTRLLREWLEGRLAVDDARARSRTRLL
jgi:hypothetical protein